MTFAISYQALSMQHDSAPLFNIIENSEKIVTCVQSKAVIERSSATSWG